MNSQVLSELPKSDLREESTMLMLDVGWLTSRERLRPTNGLMQPLGERPETKILESRFVLVARL